MKYDVNKVNKKTKRKKTVETTWGGKTTFLVNHVTRDVNIKPENEWTQKCQQRICILTFNCMEFTLEKGKVRIEH